MTPSNDRTRALFGRRQILRLIVAGAGTAAAAPRTASAASSTDLQKDQRTARYRETEHVKTFYRVNRY